jgi:hypothetical protein
MTAKSNYPAEPSNYSMNTFCLIDFERNIQSNIYSVPFSVPSTGLLIEGVLAYFTNLKCQKCIGDDVGDLKYVLTKKKNLKTKTFFWVKMKPPDTFY